MEKAEKSMVNQFKLIRSDFSLSIDDLAYLFNCTDKKSCDKTFQSLSYTQMIILESDSKSRPGVHFVISVVT